MENIKNYGKINKIGNGLGLINSIINNEYEAKEFSNFLFKNQNITFELLYQATKDGD